MLATASAPPNLPQFIARELLADAEVVASNIVISMTLGRHAGWRIERGTAQALHGKQASTLEGATALAHEARVLKLLARAPDEALRALVPTLWSYDANSVVLATELVPTGRTLHRCVVEAPGAALEAAAALGQGLARLHGAGSIAPAFGAAACPAVLRLHRPTPVLLHRLSVAGLRLVELVQEHPDFGVALDELRTAWSPGTPAHNDLKWDNIVVSVIPRSERFERVTLVDWESAGLGDPGWDIGSFFGAGLIAWARGQPDEEYEPAGAVPAAEPYPLSLIQLLSQAFWSAYHQQRGEGPPLGLTIMRYCAARLVQTALELTPGRVELPGEAVRLLQLALNIVQRPAEAAETLLGMPSSPS